MAVKRIELVVLLLVLTGVIAFPACIQSKGGGPEQPMTEGSETAMQSLSPNRSEEAPDTEKPRSEEVDPLTGLSGRNFLGPVAVVIDNLAPARPQTGLTGAGIVYEVEVEGGVTRYLALYTSDPPDLVGPVRSARPYLAVLAREWDAYLVHVGGSNAAYELLRSWKLPRLDAMTTNLGFSLDKSRQAPHNTYLNLKDAFEGKARREKVSRWDFQDPSGYEIPAYREIELTYSPNYKVKYKYDGTTGGYLRFINGEPFRDRVSGHQLIANNVIVQYARHRELGDKEGHIEIELVGRGDSEYFLGPSYLRGRWEKAGLGSATMYLDLEGKPIMPVRGGTWIEIFRQEREIDKH